MGLSAELHSRGEREENGDGDGDGEGEGKRSETERGWRVASAVVRCAMYVRWAEESKRAIMRRAWRVGASARVEDLVSCLCIEYFVHTEKGIQWK